MASRKSFFDTNILFYTNDDKFPLKQSQAVELLQRHLTDDTGVVSIQVLQEYISSATRKLKLSGEDAKRRVVLFSNLFVFKPAVHDILAAIDLHQFHKISFYDAMILRAALQSGCTTLYSEDLQHGRRIDSVQIINPFL